jgi:hypothetical protein
MPKDISIVFISMDRGLKNELDPSFQAGCMSDSGVRSTVHTEALIY